MCLTSFADARSPRRAEREQADDGAAITAPAQQPSQPTPAGAPPNPATPGGGAPQIYVWKQGNVLHAVNNPNDIPPRYANQVESADKNPRMNRMIAEGKKPATVKATKKKKKAPSKNAGRKDAP